MNLHDLFDCWQLEAQQSQAMMDQLERDDLEPHRDEFYAYWRGRRDGFEGAAFMLRDNGYGQPHTG